MSSQAMSCYLLTDMAQALHLSVKALAPVGSLTQTLMKPLAIRLSPLAGKSLVISRMEREQTNRFATFTVNVTHVAAKYFPMGSQPDRAKKPACDSAQATYIRIAK